MSNGLNFLDEFVDKSDKPTNMESILYIFWEKGIDEEKFNRLSIPYILGILKTHNWVKSEEEKAYKRANRKK